MQDHKRELRFQAGAIEALQRTPEDMMVEIFEEARRAAFHTTSVTVMLNDINLATSMLRGTGKFLVALGIYKRKL